MGGGRRSEVLHGGRGRTNLRASAKPPTHVHTHRSATLRVAPAWLGYPACGSCLAAEAVAEVGSHGWGKKK